MTLLYHLKEVKMKTLKQSALLITLCLFMTSLIAQPTIQANKMHQTNFQFQIQQYATHRQGGQMLNVYIRYGLKSGLDKTQYPDYRDLRKVVMTYLEPSSDLPENTFWEIIAQKIGNQLYHQFPVAGVSVQLLVFPNESGQIYEPGFHGPIYTIGNITALDVNPPIVSPTN
jgi:hypothetical protein